LIKNREENALASLKGEHKIPIKKTKYMITTKVKKERIKTSQIVQEEVGHFQEVEKVLFTKKTKE